MYNQCLGQRVPSDTQCHPPEAFFWKARTNVVTASFAHRSR
jgi:hypothetical protein